eukprot:TRINITY_DN36471_c0_g1_i1.p1 TRINITY_DN36471_c0_g1~~TRINITY_DN36471_c0_g1_i1.p1  ORF type:complete len:402 (+),score=92.30 TRINITY_DN36471_c0_g1_i1:106-1311(+)
MGLFGDLPPPTSAALQVRPAEAARETDEEPPLKRSRGAGREGEERDSTAIVQRDDDTGPSKITSAIAKITSHIGNPSKFGKASKLALQLLESGSVTTDTAEPFFNLLRVGMATPSSAAKLELRDDYSHLYKSAKEMSGNLFSGPQVAQLDVWLLWASVANEFHTDDSFQFSKASSHITQAITALPLATAEEDAADVLPIEDEAEEVPTPGLKSRWTTGNSSAGREQVKSIQAADAFSSGGALVEASAIEDDPFGLNSFMPQETKREEKARRRREEAEAQKRSEAAKALLLRERREAVVHCLEVAASCYRQTWAQTSIDMLMKHAFDHRANFSTRQREAIERLWASVREQQSERKHGGRQRQMQNGDATAFERLQEKYSKETISIRKGVGTSGGRSTTTWLG